MYHCRLHRIACRYRYSRIVRQSIVTIPAIDDIIAIFTVNIVITVIGKYVVAVVCTIDAVIENGAVDISHCVYS